MCKRCVWNVAHILNKDILMCVIEIHVYYRRISVCVNSSHLHKINQKVDEHPGQNQVAGV